MSKEGTVEVTVKIPKEILECLREDILKVSKENEQEYFKRAIIQTVVADLDFFHREPKLILEKHGLLKYYDC